MRGKSCSNLPAGLKFWREKNEDDLAQRRSAAFVMSRMWWTLGFWIANWRENKSKTSGVLVGASKDHVGRDYRFEFSVRWSKKFKCHVPKVVLDSKLTLCEFQKLAGKSWTRPGWLESGSLWIFNCWREKTKDDLAAVVLRSSTGAWQMGLCEFEQSAGKR